jgi:hypothetical protein
MRGESAVECQQRCSALAARRGELLVARRFRMRGARSVVGPDELKGIALVLGALVVEVYCSEWKLPDSFSDPRAAAVQSAYLFTVQSDCFSDFAVRIA